MYKRAENLTKALSGIKQYELDDMAHYLDDAVLLKIMRTVNYLAKVLTERVEASRALADGPTYSVYITGNPREYKIPNRNSSGHITCIKEIRQLTGLGLKEAKGIVDQCIAKGEALVQDEVPEVFVDQWVRKLESSGAGVLASKEIVECEG